MAGLIQRSGHLGIARGHLGVRTLHGRRGVEQGRRGNGLNMALRQRRIAIAGKDYLALLRDLEEAVDRAGGLGENRAVCGTAAAADSAAAAMHEHQVDIVLLGPRDDALLGGMQGERGGSGAGVLGGVGVAEHDLHATTGLGKAILHRGDSEHLLEHVDAALEVLELLEQRDHVEGRDVLGVRERQVRELIDIGHVARALGKRNDVAAGHLLAKALLDGPDGTERVEHLARHGGELAVNTVLADVGERAAMDHGVLTELHFHHVEAEGLDLPDEGLDRAVRGAAGTRGGQRALDHAQVLEELLSGAVHGVGVARHRGVQAGGHHEHHGAMRLGVGDLAGALGEHLAHLNLVAPQVEQLIRGLRIRGLKGEVASHATALVRELGNHVGGVLGSHLTAHLGGDVGVAVAVGTDPAAGVEERRAHGRNRTRDLAQDPVVEATVDHGNGVEQRAVEDVDDGVGFLDGRGLLESDGARAHEGVDLLQHMALVLHQVGAAHVGALLKQAGDAADLALDGLAARLRGMRGKDRVELQAGEQLGGLGAADLLVELVERHGEGIRGVDRILGGHIALALAQLGHAIVLLGQVGEVEERGERTDDDLRLVHGQGVDERHGVAEGACGGRVARGHALRIHGLAIGLGAGVAGVGADHVHHELVEDVEHLCVILTQDAALETQEQREVVAELGGDVDIGQDFDGGRQVGQVDAAGAGHHVGDHVTGDEASEPLLCRRILCHATSLDVGTDAPTPRGSVRPHYYMRVTHHLPPTLV